MAELALTASPVNHEEARTAVKAGTIQNAANTTRNSLHVYVLRFHHETAAEAQQLHQQQRQQERQQRQKTRTTSKINSKRTTERNAGEDPAAAADDDLDKT